MSDEKSSIGYLASGAIHRPNNLRMGPAGCHICIKATDYISERFVFCFNVEGKIGLNTSVHWRNFPREIQLHTEQWPGATRRKLVAR